MRATFLRFWGRLGFLGSVIHATNPRAWLKEMRQRPREKMDSVSAVAEARYLNFRQNVIGESLFGQILKSSSQPAPERNEFETIELLTCGMQAKRETTVFRFANFANANACNAPPGTPHRVPVQCARLTIAYLRLK